MSQLAARPIPAAYAVDGGGVRAPIGPSLILKGGTPSRGTPRVSKPTPLSRSSFSSNVSWPTSSSTRDGDAPEHTAVMESATRHDATAVILILPPQCKRLHPSGSVVREVRNCN